MGSVIVPMILGILCLTLGIFNIKGNISSIHWYHRHRVTADNKIPFGRMVGLGNIIIGISMLVFAFLSFLTEKSQNHLYILIGAVILVIGMISGLVLSFYAMIKYNKGIF